MQSGLYCFLSSSSEYPEFAKLGQSSDRLFIFYPQSDLDIRNNLPREDEHNLLLFDPKSLLLAGPETLNILNNSRNYVMALVSSEDENDENIKFFNLSPQIDHLIPYKSKSIESEIQKLVSILNSIKLQKNVEMTVEKTLNSLENKRTIRMSESSHRWKCFDEVGKYAEELHVFPDFPNIVRTAASELITNAFYDAPKNPDTGRSLNSDRRSLVNLIPPQEIEFSFGTSGDYMWLFVRDPFGSLDKRTVVASLLRAATEKSPLTSDEGGAGLGLKMVYEWSSELVFGLSQGESTLVGCKLKITKRNRDFDSELASLHICVKE